jgi:hypothetical protein
MSTQPRVNKLKEAMQGMAAPLPASLASVSAEIREDTPKPSPAASTRAPSRRDKKNVSGYVNREAAKQLRLLAVERDTSTQALIEEALNDLFRKYGMSAIA